jgi:hypothetical protein
MKKSDVEITFPDLLRGRLLLRQPEYFRGIGGFLEADLLWKSMHC